MTMDNILAGVAWLMAGLEYFMGNWDMFTAFAIVAGLYNLADAVRNHD